MKFPNGVFLIALGSASLVCPLPVFAFTITQGGTTVPNEGLYTSVAGATTVNFNSGLPSSPIYTSAAGTPAVVTGNLAGQYSSPPGDTTPFLTISPSGGSVPAGNGGTGPVTINFSSLNDYFGLYWGTIDTYNSIAFYRGATQIGSTISGGSNGLAANSSAYVNFTFTGPSEYFDKVVLTSTSPAFETDNHAYRAVPVPPSLFGILVTGGIGAIKAFKRKKQPS
jgi:hypothetical protein